MSANGVDTKEAVVEAIKDAETPEFEYVMPKAVRIKTLISQAAGHAIAIERYAPQVEASRMQGHQQHEVLKRDMQLNKMALGRCWLAVKDMGMSEVEFRALLDAETLAAIPR